MLLTYLILVPLLVAVLIGLAPALYARLLAGIGAAVTFVGSLWTLAGGGTSVGSFGWVENHAWFPSLGISYHLGVDGVSSLLVMLTTFLSVLAIAWPFQLYAGKEKLYFICLLVLEATTLGAFCALDLILFYVFFEVCLIPVYFLIGTLGGAGASKAAMKFFLFTVIGSLVMLAAILTLGIRFHTFDYMTILGELGRAPLGWTVTSLLFLGFAAAFAVKTPLFPFHSWLPDTYAACPAAGVALLSGAMAKLGTYGFFRFCITLFPEAAARFGGLFVALAVVGIVYAALIAAMQRDVKRVIAYSSISHLGYVVLGLFSQNPSGMSGAAFQMINHGITTGGLFLLIGWLEERTGSLKIRRLGGLWEQLPVFGRLFLILTLSAVALPLTNGFVGEFMILVGAFQSHPIAAAIATTGAIWSAIYMLWMFQRAVYGPTEREEFKSLKDISGIPLAGLSLVVVLIFALGILPGRCLEMINASLKDASTGQALQHRVTAIPIARSEP